MNASNIKLRTQPQTKLGDGYLQLKLNQSNSAVLLVNFVQEVVVLPSEAITSIPNTSKLIIGLMNWRNRIIWIVDLPRMLGLHSEFYPMRQYSIIVIRHETETIGLMVPEIKGTIRLNSGTIQPAVDQVSDILPYLNGCIRNEDEVNLVLNIEAILKSPLFHQK